MWWENNTWSQRLFRRTVYFSDFPNLDYGQLWRLYDITMKMVNLVNFLPLELFWRNFLIASHKCVCLLKTQYIITVIFLALVCLWLVKTTCWRILSFQSKSFWFVVIEVWKFVVIEILFNIFHQIVCAHFRGI